VIGGLHSHRRATLYATPIRVERPKTRASSEPGGPVGVMKQHQREQARRLGVLENWQERGFMSRE
jgi:hypothetical protein